jgi:hypothetical protein
VARRATKKAEEIRGMKKSNYCSVCEVDVDGNYCSQCGQKVERKKTTLVRILTDVIITAIDVEKSVFASMMIIVVNPKKIINNYSDGYRNYYPSPGKFLLYALAVAAIHIAYVNIDIMGATMNIDFVNPQIAFWIFELPLLTLSTFLTFIFKKTSFTQHLIANLYIGACFFILLLIVGDIVLLTTGAELGIFQTLVFILFAIIWNARVFTQRKGWWFVILNALIIFIIYCVIIQSILLLTYLYDPSSITINP